MMEIVNDASKGINNVKVIRMDRSKFMSHNYFNVNAHSKQLAGLFRNSSLLSSRREMLFQSLQQIYLRTAQLLTVLQWMQPPISYNSTQKKDHKYLKAIGYAQKQKHIGVVSDRIFIIEIERFLKLIHYDNKEITLKILYELAINMKCHVQRGTQEYILYDKFFAYLHHHFQINTDYVHLSQQQRNYMQKQKQEKQPNRLVENNIRKIGLISPESCQYSSNSEDFYDSTINLLEAKGYEDLPRYQFIGFKFNTLRRLSVNAIYGDYQNSCKLYLRMIELSSQAPNNPTLFNQQAYRTTVVSPRSNDPIKLPNVSSPQSKYQSSHQQTDPAEEPFESIEQEVIMDQNEEMEPGTDMLLSNFNQNTMVCYQVYSVNSECVAGIKLSFPEENASYPLVSFPCVEPNEGYDCHTFMFKPLSSVKGFQIERMELPNNVRLIKNFSLLVQDSDDPTSEHKLQYSSFDFDRHKQMQDVQSVLDEFIPLFNDDFRQAQFPMYFNFQYSHLDAACRLQVEDKLHKVSLVINNMFPNVVFLENKKRLINPYLFEVHTHGIGRLKLRDSYDRFIFLQIDDWSKFLEGFQAQLESLLDNVLLFIWSSGGVESIRKQIKHINP